MLNGSLIGAHRFFVWGPDPARLPNLNHQAHCHKLTRVCCLTRSNGELPAAAQRWPGSAGKHRYLFLSSVLSFLPLHIAPQRPTWLLVAQARLLANVKVLSDAEVDALRKEDGGSGGRRKKENKKSR